MNRSSRTAFHFPTATAIPPTSACPTSGLFPKDNLLERKVRVENELSRPILVCLDENYGLRRPAQRQTVAAHGTTTLSASAERSYLSVFSPSPSRGGYWAVLPSRLVHRGETIVVQERHLSAAEHYAQLPWEPRQPHTAPPAPSRHYHPVNVAPAALPEPAAQVAKQRPRTALSRIPVEPAMTLAMGVAFVCLTLFCLFVFLIVLTVTRR